MGVPLEGFGDKVRETAAEGMVLLKNEKQMFPLTKEDHVAIFGRCQINYYKSGTGSGGAVHTAYTTNLVEGLRRYKEISLNEELVQIYENWVKENPFDDGGGVWAGEPWYQKEMPVSEEMARKAGETSNKAIVVIGRTAGEDQDNAPVEGSYLLTKEERQLIETVAGCFEKTAVVLNVSNIIDMSWLETIQNKAHVCSVLYTWQGGIEAGNASADVLTGAVTPSGKLPDTIAYDIADYPSTENFGDEERNYYAEDIYVGYRYFETFAPEKVQFPFGFGLSYTEFQTQVTRAKVQGEGKEAVAVIEACVTNTGAVYSGKEVVQVYLKKNDDVEGPSKALRAFKRVHIPAGKTVDVEFDLGDKELVWWNPQSNTMCVSEGSYELMVGGSSQTAGLLRRSFVIQP